VGHSSFKHRIPEKGGKQATPDYRAAEMDKGG